MMLLTATLPKLDPKTEDMPAWDVSKSAKAPEPATAAALSAPVKATELVTLTDPGITLVTVTLVTALISAKMFASTVLTNCSAHLQYQIIMLC